MGLAGISLSRRPSRRERPGKENLNTSI
jgi:hypothetical protein